MEQFGPWQISSLFRFTVLLSMEVVDIYGPMSLYWANENGMFSNMNYGKIMNHNRFEDIIKYLQLSDDSDSDQQITDFLHAVNTRFWIHYVIMEGSCSWIWGYNSYGNGLFPKKTNPPGLRIQNFQGSSSETLQNFQGLPKIPTEFPGVSGSRNVEFPGVICFFLRISGGFDKIVQKFQGRRWVHAEFPGVNEKKWNFQGFLQNSMSSKPPLFVFFLE